MGKLSAARLIPGEHGWWFRPTVPPTLMQFSPREGNMTSRISCSKLDDASHTRMFQNLRALKSEPSPDSHV